MDLSTLKAHIKTGKLDPYYIFTGPEAEVMKIYIAQMAKVSGARVKNLDSITDLAQKAHNRTMLQDCVVFVLRDSREFLSDESLQAKITQNNAFRDSVVVFVYSTIDKRSRLYKNYQDHIVEFEHLRADVLVKYIQREVDLGDTACHKLIEVCESDYSRILLEIDKIKQFGRATSQATNRENFDANEVLEHLLKDGTIYQPPRDAVFDFVDAVLRYKPKLAFGLLAESYASGEATMVLLANLYNSAKQLLQVQAYNGTGKVSEVTGLTPFQVKLAAGRKGNYSNGDLVYLMRLTREVEKGIKTGEIEDAMSVPYVLVNFWG